MHNFEEAKTACQSMSASLLIINDKEEQVSAAGLSATNVCSDKYAIKGNA